MRKCLKFLLLFLSFCLFLVSVEDNAIYACAEENAEFKNEFNDLADKDTGYKSGNFVSHNYTYYSSAFCFNNTYKQLQFGRNTRFTDNISDEDELRMEFDLKGYVETLDLDIGEVFTNDNSKIEFKVEYSIDFGKSYQEINGSRAEIESNKPYSIYINASYETVRFKFVIANVNNKAGKYMVINNLRITGKKLYVFSIGHLIQMIDESDCDNIRFKFEEISKAYNELNDYEKSVFDQCLTDDGQTTYKERLDYIIKICISENNNGFAENNIINSKIDILSNQTIGMIFVGLMALVVCGYLIVKVIVTKTKND